jgi:flagella basal body P-ring formation protein FlgA
MFLADVIVHRGQDITLVASSGTFEVRAAGRALADAAAGTRLRVQNLSSMKVVEGMVESSDVVRVAQ